MDDVAGEYRERMDEIHRAWEWSGDGLQAVRARAALVDELVRTLWTREVERDATLGDRVCVAAIGGYGRGELFPFSDIDLLFCVLSGDAPKAALRAVTQQLWDCGLRAAPVTRRASDCERFEPDNVELALALLDRRAVAGSDAVWQRLHTQHAPRMVARDGAALRSALLALVAARHARYGDTIFHLEPNIKDCPGGLRDAHVTAWLAALAGSAKTDEAAPALADAAEVRDALSFLTAVRCFLHWRAGRDENMLDWSAQDAAAAAGIGVPRGAGARETPDAAAWMRRYFRQARVLERTLAQAVAAATPAKRRLLRRPAGPALPPGVLARDGRLALEPAQGSDDPAAEPTTVLALFATAAVSGMPLAAEAEQRIAQALPLMSERLEDGPALWRALGAVLCGRHAAAALRTMHALGLLDLLLPEFHGIDALVIRDAYHRYTVDEHTFVVIEELHALGDPPPADAPEWRHRFAAMQRELQSPAPLYLAALLHDTGKGRASGAHAEQSAAIAEAVLERWELDAYDRRLVLDLVRNHLEMSAALRRDIFDAGTVRALTARLDGHEALRMLTLFTYADIAAVHPDALTPWKAENLWRLSMGAANQMDRGMDDERLNGEAGGDRLDRVRLLAGRQAPEVEAFLRGFPGRYLQTRTADQVLEQARMAAALASETFSIALHSPARAGGLHELTLVTRDRPSLFATLAAVVAAWGMNVITADGFSNAAGVVVDTFRFTDTFGTLELNPDERPRFIAELRELLGGSATAQQRLLGRKRTRRKLPRVHVETRVEFDNAASTGSTLLQVVAQDVPGLLRTISQTLSAAACNVEVALIDTEGEMAIDVFYITHADARLDAAAQERLRAELLEAIRANAG